MTDSENPSLQTTNERELNQQLEFDTEWDTNTPGRRPSCHGCLQYNWESSTSRCVCLA